MTTKYKYTLYHRGKVVVKLNSLETAREGLEFLGAHAFIQYNEEGINSYEEAKRWEEEAHDAVTA